LPLTLFASILKTYFQSLKKDLSIAGFDPTLLVAFVSWVSLIILVAELFGSEYKVVL